MSTKSDVVVKLILVFFVSLLSFSIGTFVGKKYSDNQHKIAKLEPQKGSEHGEEHSETAAASNDEAKDSHGDRAVASEAEHGVSSSKKADLVSDEEIKKLASDALKDEEFVADDTKEVAHKEAAHKAAHKEVAHKTEEHAAKTDHGKIAEPTKAVEKVAEKKMAHGQAETHDTKVVTQAKSEKAASDHGNHGKNSKNGKKENDEALAAAQAFLDGKVPEYKPEIKKETRTPSSLPKDVAQYAVGKYTIQVGSFATKEEAEAKSAKLKEQAYQTNIMTADVKGKTWYRVSIGLYPTAEDAAKEKKLYLDKNKTESALVQKIKN